MPASTGGNTSKLTRAISAEVDLLIGDYSKAKRKLGWEPKTKFADLARLMVDADIELLRKHRAGEIRMRG
jgi:GDP-D-mannose dehydratase